MATIMDLPIEMLLIILENENVTIKDIGNFSSTCKKCLCVINYKDLWKKKYAQRWPSAKASFKDIMGVEFGYFNFQVENVKEGMDCVNKLQRYVSRISDCEKFYYCNNPIYIIRNIKKYFYNLSSSSENYPLPLFVIFDELIRNIYKQDARQSNLTERYYSIQIFQCLNGDIFKLKWQDFENSSKEQQRFEDIIVMILQWYHPDKYIADTFMDDFIDTFVQKVLKLLKDENPTHPIFSLSPEQFSIWNNNNIDKNYWNEKNARAIKYILDETIIKFNYYKLWMGLNKRDIESYNCPIVKGEYKQVTLLTIYTCVGRRLGLYFRVIGIPRSPPSLHYLAWTPKKSILYTEYFTFEWTKNQNRVKISDIEECHHKLDKTYVLLPDAVCKLLLEEVMGRETETLRHFCILPFIQDPFIVLNNSIRYYGTMYSSGEPVCEIRPPNLKYSIGLVVRHKHKLMGDDNDEISGVITGWHSKCQMTRFQYHDISCTPKELKEEYMKKYEMDDWASQPYYILLTDYAVCYIPQDTIISICTSEWINNVEIGRFFCKFEGTHYVPNKMLEKRYPNDAAVREILIKNKL